MQTNLNIISNCVDFIEKNNAYTSESIVIQPDNQNNCGNIILIFRESENLQNIELAQHCGITLKIIRLSHVDCLQALLARNRNLFDYFTNAVIYKDNLGICQPLMLAVKPVTAYNALSPARKTSKTDSEGNVFSLLFLDVGDLSEFLNLIFIPFIKSLKTIAEKIKFYYQFKRDTYSSYVELTFVTLPKLKPEINSLVTAFLYKNVSELRLNRIIVPFEASEPVFIKEAKTENKSVATQCLCSICEYILKSNSEKPFDNNRSVTFGIFLIIESGKYFFESKQRFIKVLDKLLEYYLPRSISSTTRYLIDNNIVENAYEKVKQEYLASARGLRNVLIANYWSALENWNVHTDDEEFAFLKSLECFSNQGENDILGSEASFYNYVLCITELLNIENYYKAFIPFSIKFLSNEQI